MKKTIIQCVTALLCVLALAITSVNCVDKISKVKPVAVNNGGSTSSSDNGGTENNGATEDNENTENNTSAEDNGSTDIDTPADDNSGSEESGGSSDSGNTSGNNASSGSTKKEGAKAPSSTADIVAYYNTAINKAISSKAGYSKTRKTDFIGELEGAEAIMKIKVAKDAVYNFLGIGTTPYTNKKGEAKYLSNASLSVGDVKSADCSVNGSTYTITLTLKDGKSEAPANTDTSPLKRCGLYVGNDDKKEYDYKNAQNIYVGLNNDETASVEAVSEQTKNTKIVAKIDSATGKLTSLSVNFDWSAALTKVKYIVTISGKGNAKTSVTLSNFVW